MNTERTQSKQRQLANLKPWKEGESGNPNGRLKVSVAIMTMVQKLLEDPDQLPDGKKSSTNLHILMNWQKQGADWKLLTRASTKL